MSKIIFAILALTTLGVTTQESWDSGPAFFISARGASSADKSLQDAWDQQKSNVQVQGKGRVAKMLSDDLSGSRHQRFILTLDSGQTLLMSHNIDLAPRIADLKAGDLVEFFGEYEWNNKGGVIHWTHKDPGNRHIDGWLKHNGKIYQ